MRRGYTSWVEWRWNGMEWNRANSSFHGSFFSSFWISFLLWDFPNRAYYLSYLHRRLASSPSSYGYMKKVRDISTRPVSTSRFGTSLSRTGDVNVSCCGTPMEILRLTKWNPDRNLGTIRTTTRNDRISNWTGECGFEIQRKTTTRVEVLQSSRSGIGRVLKSYQVFTSGHHDGIQDWVHFDPKIDPTRKTTQTGRFRTFPQNHGFLPISHFSRYPPPNLSKPGSKPGSNPCHPQPFLICHDTPFIWSDRTPMWTNVLTSISGRFLAEFGVNFLRKCVEFSCGNGLRFLAGLGWKNDGYAQSYSDQF